MPTCSSRWIRCARSVRAWLQEYNEERPHDALARVPLAAYRAQIQPEVLLWKCLLDGEA